MLLLHTPKYTDVSQLWFYAKYLSLLCKNKFHQTASVTSSSETSKIASVKSSINSHWGI